MTVSTQDLMANHPFCVIERGVLSLLLAQSLNLQSWLCSALGYVFGAGLIPGMPCGATHINALNLFGLIYVPNTLLLLVSLPKCFCHIDNRLMINQYDFKSVLQYHQYYYTSVYFISHRKPELFLISLQLRILGCYWLRS